MVLDVIGTKSGNEEVGVVVAFAHSHLHFLLRVTGLTSRRSEMLWQKLLGLVEVVGQS